MVFLGNCADKMEDSLLNNVHPIDYAKFEKEMHDFVKRSYPNILDDLSNGEKPTEHALKQIQKAVIEFKKRFVL